ncbi:MAG: MFS transporter [Porticoccaceae bacterium]
MRRLLLPIAALLLSDALLLIGHGIQLTLLPLRAEIEGFTPIEVALTGSTYFVGFVVGCLVAPRMVRRVGHIRAFAVLASLFSATVLLFHSWPDVYPWLALRFVVGCCMSGLYMIIESWLNDRSTRETRGTLLSIYTVINLTMMIVGQQLLNLASPSAGTLFIIASVLLSLAIVPVSLTLTLAPAPVQSVPLDFRRVWQISHVAVLGAVCAGLVTGAFWSLGPVYARGVGMETAELTLFMSAVVLGGALFQLPLGKISDRFDRRLVLLFTALLGAIVSVLVVIFSHYPQALLVLAVFWGGTVMTQYAICLAHGADNAEPHEFILVGSCILMLFGLSSAMGGPLASLFMDYLGPVGLFIYASLSLVVFAVAVAIRRQQHVVPMIDETGPFRAAADTSPAVFALDPRTEEGEWESREPDTNALVDEDLLQRE